MSDQAAVLRNLVRQGARRRTTMRALPPRVWALSGPAGAGTTHVAGQLAMGLAGQGARVVLVDADYQESGRSENGRGFASLCTERHELGIHDVLLARAGLHEILCPGPAGVLIAPSTSAGAVANPAAFSKPAQLRLLREIKAMGDYADLVIVDAGRLGEAPRSGEFANSSRVWLDAADETAYVCTPSPGHITGVYAGIKQRVASGLSCRVHLAVNRADSLEQGLEIWRRVQSTCARFLGLEAAWLGALPSAPSPLDAIADALAFSHVPEVEAMSLRALGRCEPTPTRGVADLSD